MNSQSAAIWRLPQPTKLNGTILRPKDQLEQYLSHMAKKSPEMFETNELKKAALKEAMDEHNHIKLELLECEQQLERLKDHFPRLWGRVEEIFSATVENGTET